MTSIREIKKEIRVLGLASSYQPEAKAHFIVAVVFRGKYWLDGVLTTNSKRTDITENVIRLITTSNHHPQIRVILIHRDLLPNTSLDLRKLSEEIERPVIELGSKKIPQDGLSSSWRKTPVAFVGINEKTAFKVLNMSSRTGKPEALRIAELIVESLKRD